MAKKTQYPCGTKDVETDLHGQRFSSKVHSEGQILAKIVKVTFGRKRKQTPQKAKKDRE